MALTTKTREAANIRASSCHLAPKLSRVAYSSMTVIIVCVPGTAAIIPFPSVGLAVRLCRSLKSIIARLAYASAVVRLAMAVAHAKVAIQIGWRLIEAKHVSHQ